MSNKDEESDLFNTQDKASYVLKEMLEKEVNDALTKKESEYVAIESAIESEHVLETTTSDRDKSRVLIVTEDLKVLDTSSLEHKFYLGLADRFDEVHVIVAAPLRQKKKMAKRVNDNLWLYTTGHVGLHRAPFAVQKVAKNQLTFSEGFRPDFIVATNPYESGLGAYLLAKKHDRPFQLHVREMFWTDEYKNKNRANKWRQRIARWLLNRTESVRTTTNDFKKYLEENYKNVSDLSVLPRHYSVKELVRLAKQPTEGDVFAKFAFVFLFVGRLDYKSTLFRTIDAVRDSLKLPRTVLVVVGDGPAKEEFKERAKIFGVEDKVIFKPETADLLPIMKSADLFICTDTTEASEDIVIKAAAAGSTLLLAKTELREDLFTHEEDAYLCDAEDTTAFTVAIDKFLHDNLTRNKLKEAAQFMVEMRLHEDIETFYAAYQESLERVFNVFDAAEEETGETAEVTEDTKEEAAVVEKPAEEQSNISTPPPVTQSV